MNRIITAIIHLLGGVLGEFLGAFLQNWEANHAGDNQILDTIAQLVASAQANPALTDGPARKQWVFDTAKANLTALGKTVGTSMLNILIEFAVQKLQAATG